jgi:hypothetical protein
MSAGRLGWDWQTDRIYPPCGGSLPKVELVEHLHECPDGTAVLVTAQHIAVTGTTLYRWRINGEPAGSTSARGPASEPPNWAAVDSEHPATHRSVA